MADLIDRQALGIGKAKPEAFIHQEYAYGWNSAIEAINAAPAVDAVEVVRCKDCRYLYDGDDDYCCLLKRGLPKITTTSFCSYGERRTDNANL